MSYSEENITIQSADVEYSSRSRRRAQDEPADEPGARKRRNPAVPLPGARASEQPAQDEQEDASRRRGRRRQAEPCEDEQDGRAESAADDAAEDDEMCPDGEEYQYDVNYRRRSARTGARKRARDERDEGDYDGEEYADEDYADRQRAARPRARHARPVKSRRPARHDEEYEDYQDEYYDEDAEPERRPRNRFMTWLESLRIVEELPEDGEDYEDGDDGYEDEPRSTKDGHGQRQARETRGVPVPTGRQRRGLGEDYGDEDEGDFRDERLERMRARRLSGYGGEPYDEPESDEEDARDDDAYADERNERSYGRRRRPSRADSPRRREPDIEPDEARDDCREAVEDGKPCEAERDESASRTEAEPAEAAERADSFTADETESAAPADNDESNADEPDGALIADDEDVVPVRRRARRAPQNVEPAEPASAAQSKPVGAVRRADAAEDEKQQDVGQGETLEEQYIHASLEEKRRMLFDHWREQFARNLVIPAKPEKLKAITGMVDGVLRACPDEYALGERWERIEELLDRYSSAVVAEYGYRSLLEEVQAEEKQRMFARPSGERAQTEQKSAVQPAAKSDNKSEPDAEQTGSEQATRRQSRTAAVSYDEAEGADDEGGSEYERAPRMRRQRSEFDYEPERRHAGGFSSLMNRVKGLGGHDRYAQDEDDGYEEPRGSRLMNMFRRGDVLDYSSDEPQTDGQRDEDVQYESNHERSESAGSAVDRYSAHTRPATAAASGRMREDSRDSDNTYAQQDDYRRDGDSAYAQQDGYRRDAGTYEAARPQDDYRRDSDSAYAQQDGYRRDAGTYEAARPQDDYRRDSDSAYAQQDGYRRDADSDGYRRTESRYSEYEAERAPSIDRSVYDESSEEYTADRPDYSQDYADMDDGAYPSYGSAYGFGGEADYGYKSERGQTGVYAAGAQSGGYGNNSGRYDRGSDYAAGQRYENAQYARPNPAAMSGQEHGGRDYRTRPQGGSTERYGEDQDDRWRRCSPTKDDRGGMGAPHGDTEDAGVGHAGGVRRMLNALGGALFTCALADSEEGSDDGAGGEDGSLSAKGDIEHDKAAAADEDAGSGGNAQPRAGRARSRGVKPGAPLSSRPRSIWAMVGTLALMVALGAGAYAARVVYDVRRYDDAFYEGTYLDGVALQGMDMDEAVRSVDAANAERVSALRLSVKYGDERFDISSGELGAQLDTRKKLDELWRQGHEGGYAARYAQLAQLKREPMHLSTELSYDEAALDGFLDGIKEAVDKAPRDAKIEFRPNAEDKFDITKSASGREVDIEALKADARAALEKGVSDMELSPRRLEPDFTTDDARACTGKLVTYSTRISSSSSARTSNIKLALGFYHGLRVEPGQSVDFNKLVGDRTEARGFRPAAEYSNGEIVQGIGGGVCQASTTLYGALLRAGMRIDERYNHSMTVGYVPRSQDAAVVYPGKTLTFTNNTGYPVFFTARVASDKATVTIYGYDIYPGRTISIESETLSVDEAKIKTYPDPTYQYASEPGQIVTVTTPSDGVTSRAYRVITDNKSGKVVSRESLGKDTYRRRDGVRYRGGE